MSSAADYSRADAGLNPGRDFFALMKPRVMSLVVFTALAGMIAAPGAMHSGIAAIALFAIAAGAGASGALNMWYDADIDSVMGRTAERPIPSGRVEPGEALGFGLAVAVFSVALLFLAANALAAALLAFTIFFYAVVYTMWLKRSTPQNIVIGGAAGALPPVIGWAAVTGGVTLEPLLMFLIIFVWTPPHFWALAILKHDDYARAGVPMMPNAKGVARTRLETLIYTLILAPVGASPWAFGFAGAAYGVFASAAGLGMLWLAWRAFRDTEGKAAKAACGKLFGFSILYLFAIFAALIADKLGTRLWAAL